MKKIVWLAGVAFLGFFYCHVSAAVYDYVIRVDFENFNISLFDQDKGLVATFPVALPKFRPSNLPFYGEVARIEKPAFWRPTEATRAYYFKKHGEILPKVIKPGDPKNAMGGAKIVVAFFTPNVNAAYRIHGTNDPASIGRRASRGCIRMHNEDILKLTELIAGKKTKVKFE